MKMIKIVIAVVVTFVLLVSIVWVLLASIMWKTIRYELQSGYPYGFESEYLRQYPELSHCGLFVQIQLRYEVDYLSEVSGAAQLAVGLYTTDAVNEGAASLFQSIAVYGENGSLLHKWDSPRLTSPISVRNSSIYGEFVSDYVLDIGNDMEYITVVLKFVDRSGCPAGVIQVQLDKVVRSGFFRFTT